MMEAINRRKFLKYAASAVAIGAISVYGRAGYNDRKARTPNPKVARDFLKIQYRTKLEEATGGTLEFLKRVYDVEVDTETDFSGTGNRISAEELSFEEKKESLLWLREEVVKYPPTLVRHISGLRKIKVLKNVYLDDKPVGGFSTDGEMVISLDRGASQRFTWGGIYHFSLEGNSLFSGIFHHEFSHNLQSWNMTQEDYSEWIELNPEGRNAYSKYNPSIILNTLNSPDFKASGFLCENSMKDEKEDQADIARLLMTESDWMISSFKEDAVLASKIEKCREYYYRWSGGKMNEMYWRDLSEDMIKEGYWD